MMETQTEYPEVREAKDDAERFIDGLVELVLDYDRDRSEAAADAVGWLRSRMTEAILAAYPRARTSGQRQNLLTMLDKVIVAWDTEAVAFLRQVADDDTDEDVRLDAECILQSLRRSLDLGHSGPHENQFEDGDFDLV